jgi:DNA (cytosine-5)-methyltransferase 1
LSLSLTMTDQFCGAGGTSEGAVAAGVEVKVAVNHWNLAVETHSTNHPGALHDCADISQVDPRRYPHTDILGTSPECTNQTSAKNYQQAANELTLWDPKKEAERSRATMWDVPRFAEYHRYKLILVENVVEVRSWAPYDAWLASLHSLGYQHHLVYFNSRFAGAPQSRDRLYTILWQNGLNTPDLDFTVPGFCAHCEDSVDARQTWTSDFDQALQKATKRNKGVRPERLRWGLYNQQYHYSCPTCKGKVEPWSNPAWTAIDWTLGGKRIGDSDLADNTMARIQKGIDKYGNSPLAIPMDHLDKPDSKTPYPVWRPFATQTGRQDTMLVNSFLAKLAGATFEHPGSEGCRTRSLAELAWTQTTTAETGLIGMPFTPFIAELRGGGSGPRGVDQPACTVTAEGNHHMLVNAFYDKGFTSKVGGADMVKSVATPFGTVTTRDHHGIIQVPLVDHVYGAGTPARPVSEPFGAQTTHHRFGLVEGADAVNINDCTYRMCQPHEIQRIMAFRDSYQVLGSQRDKVRQLGNAVTPPVSTLLLNRLVPTLFG